MLKPITLILYLLLAVVLATATLIEHSQGTAFVTKHIYHSVPFMVLWGTLSVLMIFSLSGKKNFQVGPKILLHLSFVVILAGALTTYLTSSKGMMHLRMGEPSFQYMEEETRIMCDLPFTLTLDTFHIDYYPGTEAPADYVSVVKIEPQPNLPHEGGLIISMNNVLDHEGYRFYQSSYDEDRRGTWLSVNYDPWGTGITYTGYALLVISMVWLMVHPRGGFRRLLKKATSDELQATSEPCGTDFSKADDADKKSPYGLCHPEFVEGVQSIANMLETVGKTLRFFDPANSAQNDKMMKLLVALIILASTAFAQGTKPLSIIPVEETNKKKEMQVIFHDRVVPLNTLARDFVKKLYGKESFSGLTSEQILLSWQRYPEEWAYVPAIRIKSSELRHKLGLEGEYARMVDLFASGGKLQATSYELRQIMEESTPPTRQLANPSTKNKPSPLQKAIIETDEKVALVMMLRQGTLIRPLPTDGSVNPLSKEKLQAELLYNRIPFTKILFMFNLTMGILLIVMSYKLKATWSSSVSPCLCVQKNKKSLVARNLLLVALTFALTGYLLRWYIGGRIPLSNGYETMLFLALCIMALALFMSRRFRPAIAFGFLLSGFTLLVSYLGEMNPQITPLMPVLVSPWLSLHVSVIMMSYALFAFILLNGVWALCIPREAERLMTYSQLMLYPAVFLLAAGIFIGAVWANVSWGRYWGWDPKEVWALITLLIYALPLHGASLPWFRRPKCFHIYLIVAFLTVLITYFGVNFFLGGMHSYT